jgi:hypothetical protein
MILIKDNFFEEETFFKLQDYAEKSEYNIVTAGDKQFSTLQAPSYILPLIQIDGYDVTLSFIRRAYNGFDEEPRIHCDGIIMNEKTSFATVIYINNIVNVTSNGTAFYEHELHGARLSEDASEDEFNRLILEDSNNESKWRLTDFVSAKPNRMLRYDARMFHSKYPNKITEGIRIVLVAFYTKSK